MHKVMVIRSMSERFTSKIKLPPVDPQRRNYVHFGINILSFAYRIGQIIQNRQAKVWLHPDFLFRLTNQYQEHQKCISILHEFSYRVIHERKAEIAKQNINNNTDEAINNNTLHENLNKNGQKDETSNYEIIDFPKKKRLAFLDLLIDASQDGSVLSIDDIREEVDTFMFEGHDTTSASICWTLFLLGGDSEIQQRAFEEIDLIMQGDRKRPPTMQQLNEMKYLECAIKDSLRLYPSVPFIGRHLHEDVVLGEFCFVSNHMSFLLRWI